VGQRCLAQALCLHFSRALYKPKVLGWGSDGYSTMNQGDSIVAPATAVVPSGVAIVRFSGVACKKLIPQLFQARACPFASPRTMVYGTVRSLASSDVIDTGLGVYFPAPASYTGEDVFELQVHGSPVAVRRIIDEALALGFRMATPGEFTHRAFLNGKLDLLQVEAVSDVIHATSEQALRLANEQLAGKYSNAVHQLGEPLRDCLAEIEASLDFPEEDIAPDSQGAIRQRLLNVQKALQETKQAAQFGISVREGLRVLLYGLPNAGKSSLLNQLLGTDRAIVTEISGTTRDVIEESAEWNGYRFVLCDTAGIADTLDTVELLGIQKTKERLEWADVVLLVADATAPYQQVRELQKTLATTTAPVWVVANKSDQVTEWPQDWQSALKVSALTNAGISELQQRLMDFVCSLKAASSEASAIITNVRQRSCIVKAEGSLQLAIEAIGTLPMECVPMECVSAELRMALASLQEIVGETSTEDILGRIFSKFCIGK
jgi:tRNA modification GTPase